MCHFNGGMCHLIGSLKPAVHQGAEFGSVSKYKVHVDITRMKNVFVFIRYLSPKFTFILQCKKCFEYSANLGKEHYIY